MGEKPPDISDEFLEAALNELEFGSVAAPAASAPQFSSGYSGATTGAGNQVFAWTYDEDKILENSIAEFGLDSPDLYEKISARFPNKTIEQIKQHLHARTRDVTGLIKFPVYEVSRPKSCQDKRRKRNIQGASSSSAASQQYKRGLWTVEEHRQFLMGIQQYGKGDWKSISVYFVQTRTPSQVASHAQKYFNRPASTTPHEARRHSIHDTRLVDGSIVELPTRLSCHGDDKTNF